MGRIDSISQALETEHGFDLSTGKIVNVEDHHNMAEKTLLPSDVLKQLDEDELELYSKWLDAKAVKDFEKADQYRAELIQKGII